MLTEPYIYHITIYKIHVLSEFILKILFTCTFILLPIHFILYLCRKGANIFMIFNENSNIIINMCESLQWNVFPNGAIQKVCHQPRGGGGSSKIVTNSDKGGGGSSQTVMSPLMRKFCDSFQNYWFSVINISYRIAFSLNLFMSNNKRSMTLTESEFRWGWR